MTLSILSNLKPTGAMEALNAANAAKAEKAPVLKGLEKAASDFEAIFINQILKTMRESVMKTSLYGESKGEETFTSMLDQEYSSIMSSGKGMGLKETLLTQFSATGPVRSDSYDGFDALKKTVGQMHTPRSGAIEAFKSHIVEETGLSGLDTDGLDEYKSPIKGRISSFYGMRDDPLTGKEKFHKGTDIAAPEGTSIYPTMEGVVTFSGKMGGYGNLVEVRHPNGFSSRYAHNSKNSVKVGDLVTTEDKIGEVGQTGRATGPHLHFEVRVGGYAVNPQDMVHLG